MVKHNVTFGSFGSPDLPGLCKMTEESGEALQVIGKIHMLGGVGEHWDGEGRLQERLEDEMADQMAAISFFIEENEFDMDRIQDRTQQKYLLFKRWHKNVSEGRDPNDDG